MRACGWAGADVFEGFNGTVGAEFRCQEVVYRGGPQTFGLLVA